MIWHKCDPRSQVLDRLWCELVFIRLLSEAFSLLRLEEEDALDH